MRELKFRAWDTFDKKWLYPHPQGFYIFGETTCFDGVAQQLSTREGVCSLLRMNDVEVVQYIGLQDKNGKEIYEGDILAHVSYLENKRHGSPQDDFQPAVIDGIYLSGLNKNPYPIHRDFDRFPYRAVEYKVGGSYSMAYYSPFQGDYRPQDFEIVGNVFENNELLEVKL